MLLTEIVDETEERGKLLYVFKNFVSVIYFPEILFSESGEEISEYDAIAIRSRVREAAEVLLGKFDIRVEGSQDPSF